MFVFSHSQDKSTSAALAELLRYCVMKVAVAQNSSSIGLPVRMITWRGITTYPVGPRFSWRAVARTDEKFHRISCGATLHLLWQLEKSWLPLGSL